MLVVNLRIANSRPSRMDYRTAQLGCFDRNVMAICLTVAVAGLDRFDSSCGSASGSGSVPAKGSHGLGDFLEGCSAKIDEQSETRSRPRLN